MIPTTVIVGPHIYAVEFMPTGEALALNVLGTCDMDRQLIRIREGMKPHTIAETLLHEILHACFYAGGLEDEDREERTVNVLGMQLAMVLRDNPKLVAWIAARLRVT